MTIGQKLTALRKARGMTQEELSEAIGVTRQTISKWELDTSAPDLDYLCKLCDLFGVTADYLIRPERESIERTDTVKAEKTSEPPLMPPPSNTEHETAPRTAPPAKPPLNTRPAGWVLLGVSLILFIFAMIALFMNEDAYVLFILTAIALAFSLEFLLLKRNRLFTAMWTAWGIFTLTLWLMIGAPLFLLVFIQIAIRNSLVIMTFWGIFVILWLLYTAFCIGVTVRVIVKHLRGKRDKN